MIKGGNPNKMTSQYGIHYIPTHGRGEDLDFIAHVNAGSVKIMNPDVRMVAEVYGRVPEAMQVWRNHPLSEEKEKMARVPEQLGRDQAEWWRQEIDARRREADERRLPFPPDHKIIVLGINEPEVWKHLAEVISYNISFVENCHRLGLIPGALNLSVGWPTNHGIPDALPDWGPYEPLFEVMQQNESYLFLHEYWDLQGPEQNWGWWAGRCTTIPQRWHSRLKIIIGECGVDRGVAGATWDGGRGWHGHFDPERMADEMVRYINMLQPYGFLHSVQQFTLDYGSSDWRTFDVNPMISQMLAVLGQIPQVPDFTQPAPTPPPVVVPPPDTGGPETPPIEIPEIDIGELVWPAPGITTQRFGENYALYMDRYGISGHNGIDIGNYDPVPVVACADGIVAWRGWDDNYGNYVRIYHPQFDCHSFYAHLEDFDGSEATAASRVMAGDHIGVMGNTGYSTGRHLHFELRTGGMDTYGYSAFGHTRGRIDPELFFYAEGNGWLT